MPQENHTLYVCLPTYPEKLNSPQNIQSRVSFLQSCGSALCHTYRAHGRHRQIWRTTCMFRVGHFLCTGMQWRFTEIWRSLLQKYVLDYSLPQKAKRSKKSPLSFSLVLFSPLCTKMLAAIWVVVGSKPSMRILGSKWMKPAKAPSSFHFSNCYSFFYASAECFYHHFNLLYISVLWGREKLWGKCSLLIVRK